MDRAVFYFNDEDFRKAASEFARIQKVIPDDMNVTFMTGVSYVMSRNVTQGERMITQALDSIRVQEAEGRLEKDEVTHDVLVKAFVSFTNYLVEQDDLDRALEIIVLGRKVDPKHVSLKNQYKKLYALAPDDTAIPEDSEE